MEELKTLLEKWAKLEPERCRWSDDSYRESYGVWADDAWSDVWLDEIEHVVIDYPYVQIGVQEAIQAKRWHLNLNIYPDSSCGADLFADSGMRLGTASSDVSGNVAVTLLTAYLKALQNHN